MVDARRRRTEEVRQGLEIGFCGLPARERNLDAISLSNCPKLSDNRRIKTVEYTVAGPDI